MLTRWASRQTRLWAAVFMIAFPVAAAAQDSEVDPLPDPGPGLDGPRDPFGLGAKKFAYSLGLKIAEIYDNNVFLVRDSKSSDYITVLLLKTAMRYEYEAGEANLGYLARQRFFARHDEFDGLEHFLTASATVEPRPFRFEAGLEWKDLKDPFDSLQVAGPVGTSYDREFVKATADFNRYDFELTAALAHFEIDDDVLDRGNFRRRELIAAALAEAWPQVALLAEFGIQETDYDEPDFSDFTFIRFTAGARGSPSPKVRIEARAGIGRASPDDDGLVPAEDVTGLVAVASLGWDLTGRQTLEVSLRREPIASVSTGLAIAEGIRVLYRHELADQWTARVMLSWDRQEESDGSGGRRGIQTRGHLRWTSTGAVFADLGALVRTRDGDDSSLNYENFRISFGLGVQW